MDFDTPDNLLIANTAQKDFDTALHKSFWRSILNWFTLRNNQLLPFDIVQRLLPMHGQHDLGMREIEISKIVGSVGRYHDFDRSFLPRFEYIRSRWVNVDKAHLQDVYLPPVEVYKIGSVYFVKDGNHRVSVAREKGQVYIDAYVTEIEVSIPLDEHTDIDDLISRQEHIQFLEKTNLASLRPNHRIELTLAGAYQKLLEHINVHRWYMGENLKRQIPYPEAVAGWYDQVYLPLVNTIRQHQILEQFPGRTETDLYLWIIEHLYYLRETSKEANLEAAAEHFAKKFSPGFISRWLQKVKNYLARPG